MTVLKSWLGVVIVLILAGCAGTPSPEETAIAYGRALYANDADALWRLISETDRRHKDQATFRRQHDQLSGFAREAAEQLARHIDAAPVSVAVAETRATVILKFRLPDANAPAIRSLMHDWDEKRLNELSASERAHIRERLDVLAREHRLPIVEGDETIELLREAGAWHVFLNWAGGVHVTFDAAVDPDLPLNVTISPSSIVLARGERFRVSVRAKNTGGRELTTRVSHGIELATEANHLALLQCPLLVPVRLAAGESEEYESEYLLLADVPEGRERFHRHVPFSGVTRRPVSGRMGRMQRWT